MTDTMRGTTHMLAAGGLFASGTDLAFSAIGFMAAIALVIGTVSAIGKVRREGTGAGITSQIGAIVFAVLVLLSVGICAMVTREAANHGVRNTVHVDSPWGQ
jgi:hypothetical protein